jgi:hypothetical protein
MSTVKISNYHNVNNRIPQRILGAVQKLDYGATPNHDRDSEALTKDAIAVLDQFSNLIEFLGTKGLAYQVECTLATIADYAMKSRRPKGEFQRQISIAQKGINIIKAFPFILYTDSPREKSGRVEKVISEFGGSVDSWAVAVSEDFTRE